MKGTRQIKTPGVHFVVEAYVNLIISKNNITGPPMLKYISKVHLVFQIKSGSLPREDELKLISCHSHNVMNTDKIVTEFSSKE